MAQLKVVVVGGGIAGAFAAYFLSEQGRDVTLIERDEVGSHASGRNPGGLNPLHGAGIPGPLEAMSRSSFDLHLSHWQRIEQLSGIAVNFTRPPRIHVALDQTDIPGLERLHQLHSGAVGFSSRSLSIGELVALDDRINRSAILGLWTQGSAKVDAWSYTRAVVGAARALGATVETGNVTGLVGVNGRANAVVVDGMTVQCDAVIVATGPWAEDAAAWTGCPLPVEPIKGELLLAQVDGRVCQHAFAWRDAAVYGDGSPAVWLGGNEERVGFDSAPTDAARSLIVSRVGHLMPGLRVAKVVKQTAALRPVTPDDLPVIGLAPGWSNVGLALAGGRKGMLYSTAMGLAAAQLVTRGSTDLPIGPCSPSRTFS